MTERPTAERVARYMKALESVLDDMPHFSTHWFEAEAYAAMAVADAEQDRWAEENRSLARRYDLASSAAADCRLEQGRLIDALARVRELHRRVEGEHNPYCAECDEREEWPCPTATAVGLAATPES